MTNAESLVMAIAENSPEKFRIVLNTVGLERMLAYRFEHMMNILNLAIDMESVDIVKEMALVYKDKPVMQQSLVNHKYAKDM